MTATRKGEKQLNPKPFFVLGFIIVIAVGGFFILGGGEESEFPEFAACLAGNDVTMYGFDLCPNCNKQKSLIGREAFKQYIDDTGRYVRCRPTSEATQPIGDDLANITILPQYSDQVSEQTTQGDLCSIMVGRGTPTWLIPDPETGEVQQVSGWRSVPELAELSGCPVPEGAEGQTPEQEGERFTD